MKESKQYEAIDDLVHLSFFVEIGKAIVAAKSIREILDQVMDKVGFIFAPRNWSLLLRDSKTDELVFKVAVGEASDKLIGKRIPVHEGITGWIVTTGQPAIIEDVTKDKRFSDKIDQMTGFKTRSLIGVPLKTDNRVLGVIELINKLNDEPFTPLELKILSSIADFAAIAIERAFYVRAIQKISRMDHLTGVLNRRSFDTILNQEIERSSRYQTNLSVLLIDINSFKQINDTHGHLVGDEVLKDCAARLQNNVRKVDHVARFGGDEFAIVMPNTSAELAQNVKQRILDDIAGKSNAENIPDYRVSIGLHTSFSEGAFDILRNTDKALYREKDKKEPITVEENLLDFIEDEEKA